MTSIGYYTFSGCSGLKDIYAFNPEPTKVDANTFLDYSPTLYVPQGSINDYKAHSVWSKFYNIREFDPTGINDTFADGDSQFVVGEGFIDFNNLSSNVQIAIYKADGTLIYSGTPCRIDLQNGMYIVRCGKTTKKIVL